MADTPPFDDLSCVYLFASGPSYADCTFLGRRNRAKYGMTASDADFWILVNRPEGDPPMTYARFGPWKNFITGCWRAPSGIVYVSDATLTQMLAFDDVNDTSREPRREKVAMLPEGVWGLDDENVWAWGTRRGASGANEHPICRFDGSSWREVPAPGFAISSMHGIAPDLIYAVGRQSGIARWDGRAWTNDAVATGEVMTDVFVAGPDEIYATGMNGSLLEGSRSGWTLVARSPDERLPFACVAKWKDELYVGAGALGLFKRQGKSNVLDHFKPKIPATSFDVRWGMVITAENRIVGSEDGQKFKSAGNDILKNTTANIDIAEW